MEIKYEKIESVAIELLLKIIGELNLKLIHIQSEVEDIGDKLDRIERHVK